MEGRFFSNTPPMGLSGDPTELRRSLLQTKRMFDALRAEIDRNFAAGAFLPLCFPTSTKPLVTVRWPR